ncbi:transglutaminase family protein [Nocardioides sp. GY 10113]|uniref:transglutaminase family protein n=1 Tax=Nocardioides sp. GY 10113 TaxID=2569761 RepID=UPI00145836C3|nr:transglutaminase family protein [Nocardioides sp. GY 10113]
MQLRIVHTTEFAYDGAASASYNQARMTPATSPEQIVLHHRIDVTPAPWSFGYRDYFGNNVLAFEAGDPHESMKVVATSTVQVNRAEPADPSTPWEAYGERDVADRWTEYLDLPELVDPPTDFLAEVRAVADVAVLPGAAAREICRLVHEAIEFQPGATDVSTPAATAWKQRAGVVQDMVHLAIGGLRAIGIPARYVSGYVHPVASPVLGETVSGDSHAWLEWWDDGWKGFDPSTNAAPDDRYVAVARGRDYEDVPPLRGIYSGAETSQMTVSVEVTRIS